MNSTNSEQHHSEQTQYAQASDVGCIRELNEDSLFSSDNLWLVADGMGGHACGEVASQLAAETIISEFAKTGDLNESIQIAHNKIVSAASQDKEQSGMGTTVVVLYSFEDEHQVACYELAWVGDSRAYLWDANNKQLSQLSEDHSLVVRLVKSGLISAEDAQNHPQRHMITQCLGSKEIQSLSVDTLQNQWKPQQQILLCSDGLSDDVSSKTISQILSQPATNTEKVNQLVKAAKKAGGKDNISVILIDSPIKQIESPAKKVNVFLDYLKKIFNLK